MESRQAHPEGLLFQLCHGTKEEMTGKLPFDAMDKGDPQAREVVENYIRCLGEGITNLVNIFRPQVVLLSGASPPRPAADSSFGGISGAVCLCGKALEHSPHSVCRFGKRRWNHRGSTSGNRRGGIRHSFIHHSLSPASSLFRGILAIILLKRTWGLILILVCFHRVQAVSSK